MRGNTRWQVTLTLTRFTAKILKLNENLDHENVIVPTSFKGLAGINPPLPRSRP
jgi:hypothetical protein